MIINSNAAMCITVDGMQCCVILVLIQLAMFQYRQQTLQAKLTKNAGGVFAAFGIVTKEDGLKARIMLKEKRRKREILIVLYMPKSIPSQMKQGKEQASFTMNITTKTVPF
eukprot:7211793-Ditylum_brightwellii.AAC.1